MKLSIIKIMVKLFIDQFTKPKILIGPNVLNLHPFLLELLNVKINIFIVDLNKQKYLNFS